MAGTYEYALAITSQFYFCSLPIRLDTYSRCTFGCLYCFASARGGQRNGKFAVIDEGQFARRLERVLGSGLVKSALDEFLRERTPLHIGGMTDPLSSLEARTGTTLRLLQILSKYQYPAILSTKSDLFATNPYLDAMSAGPFVLQCSISSLDDDLLASVDCGTPGPTRILAAAAKAIDRGVPVAFRIQPLLPGREDDAYQIIEAAAAAGVFHVGVEHLKLPLESQWSGTQLLSDRLGIDLVDYYREKGATRVGREWILPHAFRLPRMLELRDVVHQGDMSFGAADTDLLPIGDGGCCCSGVDLLDDWDGYHFTHNYAEAIRRADDQGIVTYGSIEDEWIPSGSIARWVNSNSRLRSNPVTGGGAPMRDYIVRNWAGSPNGPAPGGFVGVTRTDELDDKGRPVYQVAPEILGHIQRARRRLSDPPVGQALPPKA